MLVIITGGTGMIGRALATDLAASGAEVVLLSRDPDRHPRLPKGARAVWWDARSAAGWGPLADGAGAIVNLAGENLSARPWTDEQRKRIVESRENAGRAVTEAVLAATRKPGVVVQSSGSGYYGIRASREVDEYSPPGDDFLARVCVRWEGATAGVETAGVRRVITRSGLVFSRRGGALPKLLLPFRMFVGGPLGSGKQRMPWIHLADEVRAIRFLISKEDASGPYNLSTPAPPTNAQLARAIGRAMGRPSLVRVPGLAVRLVLGKMSMAVLEGQRPVPRRLLEAGFRFKFPDLDSALRDLIK